MLHLYDEAICQDLKSSFTDAYSNSVVRVVPPEEIVNLAAQLQSDEITFPCIAVSRDTDTGVDTTRTNFTRMQFGVPAVIDPDTNLIYNEKAIPVNLSYHVTLLTTNQVDADELLKELMHKYVTKYFLTIDLPYESKRRIRFGVSLAGDIETKSAHREYIESGTLYQTVMGLKCEGCVQILYTPHKLQRTVQDAELSLDPPVEP